MPKRPRHKRLAILAAAAAIVSVAACSANTPNEGLSTVTVTAPAPTTTNVTAPAGSSTPAASQSGSGEIHPSSATVPTADPFAWAPDADRISVALNMITVQYARALGDIRVNAVDPGYTATDLTNHSGWQTVTEGTDAIQRLACIGGDGPTGGFFNRSGQIPW